MSTIALPEGAQNKVLRVLLHLFGLVGVLLLATGCSVCDYKFGVEERNYPQYFGPDLPTNSAKGHNNEYSWLTQLPIGNSTIQVEHGVLASAQDLERVHLPPGDYLFTSISFVDPDISSIKVTHTVGGKPLEVAGTFLFRRPSSFNPVWPGWVASGWDVAPLAGDSIDTLNADGYVRLYKVALNHFLPDGYLFSEPLQETLSITVGRAANAQHYDFNLTSQWHCSSTLWQRLLSIT